MKVTATQAKKQHAIPADLAKRHEKDRRVTNLLENARAADRRLALQDELSQLHSNLASHRDVNVRLLMAQRARAIRAHGIHLRTMPFR